MDLEKIYSDYQEEIDWINSYINEIHLRLYGRLQKKPKEIGEAFVVRALRYNIVDILATFQNLKTIMYVLSEKLSEIEDMSFIVENIDRIISDYNECMKVTSKMLDLLEEEYNSFNELREYNAYVYVMHDYRHIVSMVLKILLPTDERTIYETDSIES